MFGPPSSCPSSLHPYLLTSILFPCVRTLKCLPLSKKPSRKSARAASSSSSPTKTAKPKPQDLARPGHVFPLRARNGGVLVRAGQTEASVDLARIAGLSPAGVICEIMNEDGTMSRVPQLTEFCKEHNLKMLTVADLIRYRMQP